MDPTDQRGSIKFLILAYTCSKDKPIYSVSLLKLTPVRHPLNDKWLIPIKQDGRIL